MFNSIFRKLLPDETPITLIRKHAELIKKSADLLPQLLEDYFAGKDIDELVSQISDMESQADDIKFQLRELINKSIKTPFGRSDFKDYIHTQDNIIDCIEDVAKKLSLNRMEGVEEDAKSAIMELVNLNITGISYLCQAIDDLRKVIDSYFDSRASEEEKRDIIKVTRVEGDIDKLTLKLGRWIYSKKHQMNPIDLIFFRELVRILSEMADATENTAEKLMNFIIR